MLAITFSAARFDRADTRNRYDLILGVEATLALVVGSRTVFTEPMFPIVELRVALKAWLDSEAKGDFEF